MNEEVVDLGHEVVDATIIIGSDTTRRLYTALSASVCTSLEPMTPSSERRGKQTAEKLDTMVSYWTEYVMYKESERELRFPPAVCASYQQDNQDKYN